MEANRYRSIKFIVFFLMLSFSVWATETKHLETNVQIKVSTTSTDKIETEKIVVALIPKFAQTYQLSKKEIEQINAQFRPFITIAQTGTTIELPNKDDFAHHVYSFSQAMSFELSLYGGGKTKELLLENSGIVPIGCNIHDWMLGYIVVVDTPYYTFLNGNNAKFENIPVGEYQLALWHPSMDEFWTDSVSITNAESQLDITLPVTLSSVAPLATPNLDNSEDEY